MNTEVLLVIDNSRRELVSVLLIQHYLQKLGFSSQICSRFILTHAFNKFRPKVVILPNAGDPLCESLSKCSFVCILPSESGNGQHSQVLGIMKGTVKYRCYTEYVDLFFSWGKQMAEWLSEDGVYTKEQIQVTGNPATDHWLLPAKKRLSGKMGLTTTFRTLSNTTGGLKNAFERIYKIENCGGDGTYYISPEHAEVWIYWEAAFIRLICNIVDDIVIPHKVRMELRPHPFENKRPYEFLVQQSRGLVQVTKEEVISDWFQNIDLLVTFMSGSSIDAVVRGLPVVSLKNVLNQDALSRIPKGFLYDYDQYLWQLKSLEQIKEYSLEAFKGSLPVAREPEKLKTYIQKHFHFPRKKPSALLVAESITDLLENNRHRKFKHLHTSSSVKTRINTVLKHMPYSTELVMGYKWLDDYLEKRDATRATYLPWKWKEISKARDAAAKIVAFYEENSHGI